MAGRSAWSLDVEGEMRISDQVGVPVAPAGRAADDDHAVDNVEDELDPPGPAGPPTGGRDVDAVRSRQRPLDAPVQMAGAADVRKLWGVGWRGQGGLALSCKAQL
jgi:hypothetical protein